MSNYRIYMVNFRYIRQWCQ